MRLLLCVAVLATLALVACGAPCDPITPAISTVCHQADAGAIAANSGFVLRAEPNTFASSCTATVDGGAIVLTLNGGGTCSSGSGQALQAVRPVPCAIPALPAGTYSVNTLPNTTLTIPQGADGGVPVCAF